MKKFYIFTLLIFTLSVRYSYSENIELMLPPPPTDINSNTVWGPGIVTVSNNITVSDDIVLTILPSTSIVFDGYYKINVKGTLIAEGTLQKPIVFTKTDTTGLSDYFETKGAWGGVRFDNSYEYGGNKGIMDNNEQSRFTHCKFRYSKAVDFGFGGYSSYGGAMLIAAYSNIFILDCEFEYCGAEYGGAIAIVDNAAPEIEKTQFIFNRADYGGGIFVDNKAAPLLSKIVVCNNFGEREGGGIYTGNKTGASIVSSLINNNESGKYGGGIFITSDAQTELTNSTIVFNKAAIYGGGMYCKSNSQPVVYNSIIYNNDALFYSGPQVYLNSDNNLTFYYSNIEGGKDDFGGYTFTGVYYSCIDVVPEFIQPSETTGIIYGNTALNYDVAETSGCINAGAIDLSGLDLNGNDLAGNNRVYGGKIDIGAYENQNQTAPPDFIFKPANLFVSAKTGKTQISQVKILKVNIDNLNLTQSNLIGLDVPFAAEIENDLIFIRMSSSEAGIFKDTLFVETQYGTKEVMIHAEFGEIGDVSGSWGKDTIRVIGDITIPAGKTLIIEPGTLVEFQNYYGMHVLGRLLVVGLASDSVRFAAADKSKGWKGVRFQDNLSLDSSKIMYTVFEDRKPISIEKEEYGSVLLLDSFKRLSVIHSTFRNNKAANGAAIQCINHSSAKFYKNSFVNNYANNGGAIFISNAAPLMQQMYFVHNRATLGGAVYIENNSAAKLLNMNAEYNNAFRSGGAFYITTGSESVFWNCSVSNNEALEGGGLFLNESSPEIINNTIAHNHSSRFAGGVFCGNDSHPEFVNTVIYYNTDQTGSNQLYLTNELVAPQPVFDYCNIEGGTQQFSGEGAAIYSITYYTNSMNENPLFIGGNRFAYRLKEYSPCRNAAHPQSALLNVPPTDILGSQRYADGKMDIGAFEFVGNYAPVVKIEEKKIEVKEKQYFKHIFDKNTFSDIDTGDSLRIAVATGGFENLTWIGFDKSQPTFTGYPTNNETGQHEFTISATDDYGATAFSKLIVDVINVNDPPTLNNPLENTVINEQELYSFSIPDDTFNDIDKNDVLTLSAGIATNPIPEWLSFNSATKSLVGTPLTKDIGSYNITITATDTEKASVSANFTITVDYINHKPELLIATDNLVINEDEAFEFTIPENMFSDINPDDILTVNLNYISSNEFPHWLVYNIENLTISGIPENDDVGIYSFSISAYDDDFATATDEFTVEVINTNDTPVFDGEIVSPQNAFTETYYEYTINSNLFYDIDEGDELTFTATQQDGTPLPDWLTFDPVTLTISGTPPAKAIGVTTLRIYATDTSGASVFAQYSLFVQYGTSIRYTDNKMNTFRISPNPANNKVHIEFDIQGSSNENIQFFLFNGSGSLIDVLKTENNTIANKTYSANINLSKYAKGLYYIRLISKSKVLTQKLLIE